MSELPNSVLGKILFFEMNVDYSSSRILVKIAEYRGKFYSLVKLLLSNRIFKGYDEYRDSKEFQDFSKYPSANSNDFVNTCDLLEPLYIGCDC